jgi:hypothetical protein
MLFFTPLAAQSVRGRVTANGGLTAQINNGVSAYPINTPFGMNGRYVYTKVSYTFEDLNWASR